MSMNHVMLDLETLGTGRDAAIVTIGACLFDPEEDTIWETFYSKVDLDKSSSPGVINLSTVEWWLRQSDDARKELLSGERHILSIVLTDFESWAKRHVKDPDNPRTAARLWSNGPTFDEMILRDAFTRYGFAFPFHYRASRCCRTIVDLAKSAGFILRGRTEGLKHSALDDAIYQAKGVCAMWDYLKVDRTHSAKSTEGTK